MGIVYNIFNLYSSLFSLRFSYETEMAEIMKVVHLISGGDTGGAKTHILSLLSNIAARMSIQMVCFMDGPFAQEAREMGIPTTVMEGWNLFAVLKQLEHFIREGEFQIIHCHGARANMMGALLRRRLKLPVVTTVHSDPRLDYMGRPISRLTYGTINAMALRRLDYRIGVSDAMVDTLISRGFDADRLFSIYNGIDFTPRTPSMNREEYLKSLGLTWPADAVMPMITARLNPVKDYPTLLRGFAKARQRCPQLRLLIAGDGAEQERLEALARELELGDTVCFAGWVTDTDSFYHALDINTLTSLSETFSYSITEGARALLPAVCSRVGGLPYLIDHGVNGFLFDPGDVDALAGYFVQLGQDKELRERMGRRLNAKAKERYSIKSTIDKQEEIYKIILRRQEKPKKHYGATVCGAYGKGNAGDDAILEAIVQELRAVDPDLPIWVLSRTPKETRLKYRVNALYTFRLDKFWRRLGRGGLYINGGGSLMQDVTSRRSLWFYLLTISMAHKRRNKVLMYGCGIGPIQYASNRRRCARVLQNNVDAITLRDVHSKEELAQMGVTRPKIILAADPTVILPAAEPAAVDGLLEQWGLDKAGKYICFSLRTWPGFEEKVDVFAAGARYACETHGLTPVFLPIEARLDTPAAQKVADKLGGIPHFIAPQCATSAQVIGMFARMEAVVSMRLHALVFAAGQGVPLVGIVYDQKVSSFLDYIGQDLYTDLKDVSVEGLCASIDKAVARTADKEFLLSGVERLREVEGRNSETAARLLKGETP